MKLRNALPILGMLCFLAPAQAAPGLQSNVKDAAMPLPACMTRAKALLSANGFTEIGNATYSTWGFFNNHTAVIRCVPDKQLAVFMSAGDNGSECERLVNLLHRQF